MSTGSNLRGTAEQWMRMQRDLMEQLVNQMRNAADLDARGVADQMTDAWNRAIETSSEVQRQWVRTLREEIASMDGVSSDAASRISEIADEFDDWAGAQERFWKEWVQMMRNAIPADALNQGQHIAQSFFDVMQKGTRAFVDATSEVLSRQQTQRKYDR